ncbi:MAG: DUF86 domain-containing protein [Microbacterium sp.]
MDADTAALVPDLVRIVGLRNVLAHGYAVVNDDVVWSAATIRVPEPRSLLRELLADRG